MSLYSFSVKKPITLLMIVCVVIIIGIVSLTKIPLDLLPKIEVPVAVVSTSYKGVGPEEIEKLVTEPIEGAVATVGSMKNIQSISYDGNSLIIVEFNSGTDMDFASLEMREKIDLVKGFLPDEVENPMVIKVDPNAMPIIQLSFYSEEDLGKLQSILMEIVKPRIERIEGVANVSLSGGKEKEVSISLEEGELEKYGLTIDKLVQLIGAENFNLPAGQIKKGNKKLSLKTVGEFQSIEDIKSMPIPLSTGGVIHLRDIADVSVEDKETTTVSRINGKEGINISIQKQSDSNTVRVSEEIHKELEAIEKDYPDLDMEIVLDQAEYINMSIMNVFKNAIIGAVLAVAILYLFLRDLKTTLIISVSIPISIIATFILLYFGNITFNIMTLGGMALGIGMLVDNSIVVLENIYRLRENGLDSQSASIEGAKEVSMAVSASTLTTIAVFAPMVFVEGITATIFKELAFTVAFSLVISLLVSLTLIPMLASRSLKKEVEEKNNGFSKVFRSVRDGYESILSWALNHKGWAIFIAVAIFVVTIFPLFILGGEFFPPVDEGTFIVNIDLPSGSSFQETNKVIEKLEKDISKIKEVDTMFSSIGGSSFASFSSSTSSSDSGSITVKLKGLKERDRTTFQVADEVRKIVKDTPGVDISVDTTSDLMGGLGGDPINIEIKGENLDSLKEIGEDFKEIVNSIPGTREVKTSYEEGVPEVKIGLDRDLLSQYGLTTYQVASAVRGSISGVLASKYKYEGTELDIVVKRGSSKDETIESIKSLPIMTPMGSSVPLEEVGKVSIENSPVTIYREDQSRVVNITGQVFNRDMETVINEIENKLKEYKMPYGYSYGFEGQYKQLTKAYSDLTLALILALVFVYIILAAQFESFIYPFIVMLSVPLSFSGASLFLLLSGKTLSVPAIVGGIVLAGIVVNNAIVLVDYINTLRRSGMERDAAVLKAGPTRFRPILMTTLTTVLGLIPLALRRGEGSEIQSPMAVAVIGGLFFSTLLTLIFIPVMYIVFDNLRKNKEDI